MKENRSKSALFLILCRMICIIPGLKIIWHPDHALLLTGEKGDRGESERKEAKREGIGDLTL